MGGGGLVFEGWGGLGFKTSHMWFAGICGGGVESRSSKMLVLLGSEDEWFGSTI